MGHSSNLLYGLVLLSLDINQNPITDIKKETLMELSKIIVGFLIIIIIYKGGTSFSKLYIEMKNSTKINHDTSSSSC